MGAIRARESTRGGGMTGRGSGIESGVNEVRLLMIHDENPRNFCRGLLETDA